jgi:hypothetical protein
MFLFNNATFMVVLFLIMEYQQKAQAQKDSAKQTEKRKVGQRNDGGSLFVCVSVMNEWSKTNR